MVKQKYHIHIYRIVAKAEINIIAEDVIMAKEIALKFKDRLDYGHSDCNYISIDVNREIVM